MLSPGNDLTRRFASTTVPRNGPTDVGMTVCFSFGESVKEIIVQ